MAGLKGLNKTESKIEDISADQFIKGAQERVNVLNRSNNRIERTFQRYTFSLTADVSEKIDKLSLIPRDFRSSRSDVVKAAIELLISLPESEVLAALEKLKLLD